MHLFNLPCFRPSSADCFDEPQTNTRSTAPGAYKHEPIRPEQAQPPACTAPLGNRRNEAIFQISRLLRQAGAEKSYRHMLENGKIWAETGLNERASMKTIVVLSRGNLGNLRKTLAINSKSGKREVLSKEERAFLENFFKTDFFATHATAVNRSILEKGRDQLHFLSRRNLLERGAQLPLHNSTEVDLTKIANDDFVFFNMEPGEVPKKPESRFGQNLYRFNINTPTFHQIAWMSLVDQIQPVAPDPIKHLQHIGLHQHNTANLTGRRFGMESVFHGRDMLPGLALSIIRDCRNRDLFTNEMAQKILAMRTEEDVNAVVNGLYRPEIKVPRYFIARPTNEANIDKVDRPEMMENFEEYISYLNSHQSS